MFCRIYISGKNIERLSLLMSIGNVIGGNIANDIYLEKPGYSIEVRLNESFDEEKMKVFPDGFLFFPFCIEIDILETVSELDAAMEMTKILKYLWGNNYPAIASCDFENMLPENGGYKSENIPWIC